MVNVKITSTEKIKLMTYKEWQAFLKKVLDCTCKPDSALACRSCREYSRKKYGDSIPFGGE